MLAADDFEITPDMIIWKAMFLPDCLVRAVWELGFHNPTAIQVMLANSLLQELYLLLFLCQLD